jgi:hypothetical protein
MQTLRHDLVSKRPTCTKFVPVLALPSVHLQDFQANYASLTTFDRFMGSHQFLSKDTSASESAKLCFLASEYAFFQRHFMALVTRLFLVEVHDVGLPDFSCA